MCMDGTKYEQYAIRTITNEAKEWWIMRSAPYEMKDINNNITKLILIYLYHNKANFNYSYCCSSSKLNALFYLFFTLINVISTPVSSCVILLTCRKAIRIRTNERNEMEGIFDIFVISSFISFWGSSSLFSLFIFKSIRLTWREFEEILCSVAYN